LSRLFCGHKRCSLPEVSIISFLPLQFFVSVRLSKSNFLIRIKNVGKIKVLYIFKIVSVLTFLKIVIISTNHKYTNLSLSHIASLVLLDAIALTFMVDGSICRDLKRYCNLI
jgi:hypothetical protein